MGGSGDADTNDEGGSDADEPTVCEAEQAVSEGACVPCAAGTSRPAGDNAPEGDTSCDAVVCSADERVSGTHA